MLWLLVIILFYCVIRLHMLLKDIEQECVHLKYIIKQLNKRIKDE